MSEEEGRSPELKPARPEGTLASEGRPAYLPRFPWVWVIGFSLLIGGLVAGYTLRQTQREEALRGDLMTLHRGELSDFSARYLAFRERIEALVIGAAQQGEPESWAHSGLNISGLRSGEGLYLRIMAEDAVDPERILAAALVMQPDAINRCLGISATSMRSVYSQGDFLTPAWVQQIEDARDLSRLRVLEDQLGRHLQVDLPVVSSLMRSDWFMLVIQQGPRRSESPVDVYLWDLRNDRALLRGRIQGRGMLVPIRVNFPGAPRYATPGRQSLTSTGATDCSIASQIRALAGQRPLELESTEALLEQAAQIEAEAEAAAATNESAEEGTDDEGANTEEAPAPASTDENGRQPSGDGVTGD